MKQGSWRLRVYRWPAVAALLPLAAVAEELPAFPGAEGFGAMAKGGRGGDVYVVTQLGSSGSGSFYEAVTTVPPEGRTVVFEVSGEIHLAGRIKTRITGNRLTVAGQTAPGDGILLRDGTLRLSGDDLVLRHLRIRHGRGGSGGDCLNLDSECENAMLDHVSLQFGKDENMSSFKRPPENVTLQWSLNAWGLETHSCGGLWDQNHATCHHSLWAHNHTRNPKARPGGLLEWTNNVVFDWDIGFIMGDSATPASWKANVIGNYFICPPGNLRSTPLEKARLDRHGRPNFSVHVSDNLHDHDGDRRLDGEDRGWEIVRGEPFDERKNPKGNYIRLEDPVEGSGRLVMDSPRLAYKKVVSDAGALRLDHGFDDGLRDEVDARLIENVVELRANHIKRASDLEGVGNEGFGVFREARAMPDGDRDGMPDAYEAVLGSDPQEQDHNELVRGESYLPEASPGGYTRLEEYLHFKAVPHCFVVAKRGVTVDLDLSRYTSGFTRSPEFELTEVVGGTAKQGGAGGKLVRFKPNRFGRAGFTFTVRDADGDAWTRPFAICVIEPG